MSADVGAEAIAGDGGVAVRWDVCAGTAAAEIKNRKRIAITCMRKVDPSINFLREKFRKYVIMISNDTRSYTLSATLDLRSSGCNWMQIQAGKFAVLADPRHS